MEAGDEAALAELEEYVALELGQEQPVISSETKRHVVKTLGEVAEFFGLALQTVKQWRTGPDPMPGKPGIFDLGEITRWRFRKTEERPQSSEQKELDAEKTRLENARLKLRLAKDAGKLIDRATAEATARRMALLIKNRLESLPSEMASGFAPEQRADVIANWENQIRMALRELEQVQRV